MIDVCEVEDFIFFDIYGLIDRCNYGDIIPLATIKTKEKSWYSRLYRDCIL